MDIESQIEGTLSLVGTVVVQRGRELKGEGQKVGIVVSLATTVFCQQTSYWRLLQTVGDKNGSYMIVYVLKEDTYSSSTCTSIGASNRSPPIIHRLQSLLTKVGRIYVLCRPVIV